MNTNRALDTLEIISNILDLAYLSSNDKSEIAKLGLVCRQWHGEASRVLWREVDLEKVLQVLVGLHRYSGTAVS